MKKELMFEEQERAYAKRHPERSSAVIIADRQAKQKAMKRRAVAEYVGIAVLMTLLVTATVVGLCAIGG